MSSNGLPSRGATRRVLSICGAPEDTSVCRFTPFWCVMDAVRHGRRPLSHGVGGSRRRAASPSPLISAAASDPRLRARAACGGVLKLRGNGPESPGNSTVASILENPLSIVGCRRYRRTPAKLRALLGSVGDELGVAPNVLYWFANHSTSGSLSITSSSTPWPHPGNTSQPALAPSISGAPSPPRAVVAHGDAADVEISHRWGLDGTELEPLQRVLHREAIPSRVWLISSKYFWIRRFSCTASR